MTDTELEAAFQLAIDMAGPDKSDARLVFADWLDDRAAEVACPNCKGTGWTTWAKAGYTVRPPHSLPDFATAGCPPCGGERDRRGSGRVPTFARERAAGYRVLVQLGRWPDNVGAAKPGFAYWSRTSTAPLAEIDQKWWYLWRAEAIAFVPPDVITPDSIITDPRFGILPYRLPTRAACDDLAALAWAKLDPADQARILRGERR